MQKKPTTPQTPESLCYLERLMDHQVKPLTAEVFCQLIDSPRVKSVMQQIEAEPDQEKKNLLKQTLPAAIYGCLMTADGGRPRLADGNAVSSGLCIHDFDHMGGNVRQLFETSILPLREEIGLMLAHVTPRGEGLRLVTKLQAGESIPACQQRVAERLSLSLFADRQVKDMMRLSFIPTREYILYQSEELFHPSVSRSQVATEKLATHRYASHSPAAAAPAQSASLSASPQPKTAEVFEYQGIKYSAIIEKILSRIATDGHPQEGERNDDLYLLVRELRHVCDYQFDMLHMLIKPYFMDLPDSELRRSINSALNSPGRTMTPTVSAVIHQLKCESDDVVEKTLPLPRMPKLPPLMGMMVRHYPANIQPLVVLAMLPILGTYGTHVHFRYLDNRLNSLSFMTAVVGKSSRGKGFVNDLFDKLTPMLAEWDQQEREKDQRYQLLMDRRKQDEDYPEDPRAKVRLLSDDTTTSQLLEYLDNLNGEHALQFTEEVARLCKARSSRFGDNDDLYCKAFDNAIGGKESKNRLTRNIRTKICLNTLFCGTYVSMHKFYNNPEGGLNNRVIFAALPERRHKGVPRYEELTDDEQLQLDDALRQLWLAGSKEEEDGVEVVDLRQVHMGQKEFAFPFLDKAFTKWIATCDKQDEENPDETWRDLANRAAVIGYRAGVLAWLLWGRPEDKKTLDLVKKFALWMAEVSRIGVYNFCGNEYDQINEQENNQPRPRNGKNKLLFSLLPESFITQDLVELRQRNGDSQDVRMVIHRWISDELIKRDDRGKFHKLKNMAG